jgi:hypothetical protein
MEVKESKIYGKGVFATSKIHKGYEFIVLNDIQIGEELTLYYNDTFNKKNK